MEEALKLQLSNANLTSATNANAKVSRTRQKINDSKNLESQLLIQQQNSNSNTSNNNDIVQGKGLEDTNIISNNKSLKSLPTTAATTTATSTVTDSSPIGKNSSVKAGPKTGPVPPVYSPPKDKWSTDIFPEGANPTATHTATKLSMNKAEPSKKLTCMTSSFLGKAIDLDYATATATVQHVTHSTEEQKEENSSRGSNKASYVQQQQVSPTSDMVQDMHKMHSNSSSSSIPTTGSTKAVIHAAASTSTATSNSGAVLKGVPVVQGRRPPPLPATAVVNTGTRPVAHLRDDPIPGPVAHLRDGDAEEYDETDAFFHEADEAVADERVHYTSSRAKIFPIQTETSEIKTGLSRVVPINATSEQSDEEDEEEELGHSTTVSDQDYDEVYGTLRCDTAEEGDDDLEELARSAVQSRCASANSSAQSSARRSTDMTSPLPGSTDGASGILRMPSIDENQAVPVHKPTVPVHKPAQDIPRMHGTAAAAVDAVKPSVDYVMIESSRQSSGSDYDAAADRGREEEHDQEEGEDEGGDGENIEEHHDQEERDEEHENESDEKTQIRVLRSHAKVLEGLNDIPAAEGVYMRALELDPTNITTLEQFAMFLHQKKGELLRAEAFFNRGLQICLPGIQLKSTSTNNSTNNSTENTPKSIKKNNLEHSNLMNTNISFNTYISMQGNKISSIIKFIISYAYFMYKSKGDIEIANILYKKGLDIDSENRHLLATYAYFLGQLNEIESSKKSIELFQKVLKLAPNNIQYILWYAKILKKSNKYNQSELMYKVAYERSKNNSKYEPISICNYATFIFKQRKDVKRASALFKAGLELYPKHKGLKKNYATLLKSNPVRKEQQPPPTQQQQQQQQQCSNDEGEIGMNTGASITTTTTTGTTTATVTAGNARAEWLARRAQAAEDQRKLEQAQSESENK